MMTKDEIMKVLDAMNYAISPSGTFWVKKHNEAKQILQAALAEPQITQRQITDREIDELEHNVTGFAIHPDDAHKFARAVEKAVISMIRPSPLTDEDICKIEKPHLYLERIPLGGQYDFARAVEAAVLGKLK